MLNIHIARISFIVNCFVFTTQISLTHGPTFMHMLSLSCWQDYTLLLKFTFVIRITLVEILLYMHGSFYGDTMAKVYGTYGYTIMWHVMCEGRPLKVYMRYLLLMVTMWERDICMVRVNFI